MEREAFSPKTETYYRKIIELAGENDIPLLIGVSLYAGIDETLQQYTNFVNIDGTDYKKVTNGINITVYNPLTQCVVDSFGFDMDNNYNIVR